MQLIINAPSINAKKKVVKKFHIEGFYNLLENKIKPSAYRNTYTRQTYCYFQSTIRARAYIPIYVDKKYSIVRIKMPAKFSTPRLFIANARLKVLDEIFFSKKCRASRCGYLKNKLSHECKWMIGWREESGMVNGESGREKEEKREVLEYAISRLSFAACRSDYL